MKIALLLDRIDPQAGPDQLDTLVQAQEIGRVLSRLGHQADLVTFDPGRPLVGRRLAAGRVGAIFNLVESVDGRGERIHLAPALLERLGLPFTGSGSEAVRSTTDKLEAKSILKNHGLPTPGWLSGRPGERGGPEAGRSYILKSVWEHGSLGLDEESLIRPESPDQVWEAISARRTAFGGDWFAEAFIQGREFNLSLLSIQGRPVLLPPAEILFTGLPPGQLRIVGYRAKWVEDSVEYRQTPRRFTFGPEDQPLLAELGRLARACWDLFDLRGYARVDFRVDRKGRPWILEVNANPCLAAEAGFVAAAARAGMDQATVVERILTEALVQDRPAAKALAASAGSG